MLQYRFTELDLIIIRITKKFIEICHSKTLIELSPRVLPLEWFKRLIIKHFDHTFDREKTRKLKIIFLGEISVQKFSNLKFSVIFEIENSGKFSNENPMKTRLVPRGR